MPDNLMKHLTALPKTQNKKAYPVVDWELVADGEHLATIHCQLSKNSMGGWTKILGSAERLSKEICQAVNEHEALTDIAELATAMRTHKNLPASMRLTHFPDLWKDMEAALDKWSAVREGKTR